MGDILPDGSIQGYSGYCQTCNKQIQVNSQGNETGSHICKYICFQCKYPITISNNGMIINKGHATEMYLCNDCHLVEFGHNINSDLLIFI